VNADSVIKVLLGGTTAAHPDIPYSTSSIDKFEIRTVNIVPQGSGISLSDFTGLHSNDVETNHTVVFGLVAYQLGEALFHHFLHTYSNIMSLKKLANSA